MVCTYCNGPTQVTNSRTFRVNSHYVWRRRRCKSCSSVITSREEPLLSSVISIETSEGLESLPDAFITIELSRALPEASPSAIEDLATTAKLRLLSLKTPRITRARLLDITHQVIDSIDSKSAMKFAIDNDLPMNASS